MVELKIGRPLMCLLTQNPGQSCAEQEAIYCSLQMSKTKPQVRNPNLKYIM